MVAQTQQVAELGSWEWDIPTNTVTWSEELCRLLGAEPAAFGATLDGALALAHPEDRDLLRAAIDRASRDHAPYASDHRVVRPDGAIRFFHSRGRVLANDRGEPVKMFGTAQDVTQLKQAEDVLARYAAIVEGSDDAIVASTLDGRILSWNPGAERLYAYRADEIEGCSIATLIPPEALRGAGLDPRAPEARGAD